VIRTTKIDLPFDQFQLTKNEVVSKKGRKGDLRSAQLLAFWCLGQTTTKP
jgi:hypothetical protein